MLTRGQITEAYEKAIADDDRPRCRCSSCSRWRQNSLTMDERWIV